jgi:hypothetical protein
MGSNQTDGLFKFGNQDVQVERVFWNGDRTLYFTVDATEVALAFWIQVDANCQASGSGTDNHVDKSITQVIPGAAKCRMRAVLAVCHFGLAAIRFHYFTPGNGVAFKAITSMAFKLGRFDQDNLTSCDSPGYTLLVQESSSFAMEKYEMAEAGISYTNGVKKFSSC